VESIRESPLRRLSLESFRRRLDVRSVEVIAEYPFWIKYAFPNRPSGKKVYPFDGQTQKYFLVKLKKGAEINLDSSMTRSLKIIDMWSITAVEEGNIF